MRICLAGVRRDDASRRVALKMQSRSVELQLFPLPWIPNNIYTYRVYILLPFPKEKYYSYELVSALRTDCASWIMQFAGHATETHFGVCGLLCELCEWINRIHRHSTCVFVVAIIHFVLSPPLLAVIRWCLVKVNALRVIRAACPYIGEDVNMCSVWLVEYK